MAALAQDESVMGLNEASEPADPLVTCFALVVNGSLQQRMVPPAGIEPATHGLGNRCSIH